MKLDLKARAQTRTSPATKTAEILANKRRGPSKEAAIFVIYELWK